MHSRVDSIQAAREKLKGLSPAEAAMQVRLWAGVAPVLRIDVTKTAHQMGVTVFPDHELEGAGLAKFSSTGAPEIYFRPSGKPERDRFTIAHELGHLLLHDLPPEGEWRDRAATMYRNYGEDSQRKRVIEAQANYFASELLMPVDGILEKSRTIGMDEERLATHFEVSTTAMGIAVSSILGQPYRGTYRGRR